MASITAKTRTIANGTAINAVPVESSFIELYANDAAINTSLITTQATVASVVTSFVPTGAVLAFSLSVLPTGWIWANGQTVGAGPSGAIGRANADTQALFYALWASYSNVILPIQDSTGTATSRGVSAIADFSANKRLPVPDYAENMIIGTGAMGGAPDPSRVTGASLNGGNVTTLGGRGGQETHAQTASEMANHTHAYQDQQSGPGGTYGGAAAFTPVDVSRTTNGAGLGTPANVMNPWLAQNYIIKL